MKHLGWLRDNLTGVTQHLVEQNGRNRFVSEDQYRRLQESWTIQATFKPGRNDPCPCGSGRKYKKCHGT